MTAMQEKLAKETKKMEVAERRRKLELDGYAADLSAMTKKIQFFQKFVAKMKKAVDQERGMELIDMSDEEEESQHSNEDPAVNYVA